MEDTSATTLAYNEPDTAPTTQTGPASLRDARAEFDRVYLDRLLQVSGGDIRRAAAIAEIHPKSFERLMRRRGVRRRRS